MSKDTQLSDSDGVVLVKTARKAVTEFLSNGNRIKLESDLEEKFSFNSGVFVTLNNPDGLRGCIGFPMPEKKLSHGIIDAAISAATEDPRFPSVKTNELNDIVFEVTVLTPPVEIDVSDPTEYLEKIKVGRDGLIIKHSFHPACYCHKFLSNMVGMWKNFSNTHVKRLGWQEIPGKMKV